ncbi:MAG: right-handed parallel beta-helix repeat-containing protein [Bacteroidales bacterium]
MILNVSNTPSRLNRLRSFPLAGILIFPVIAIFLLSSCSGSGKVKEGRGLYLSSKGSDDNPGTFAKPWLSLDRLGRESLEPGDRVYLEGGTRFKGTLVLDSVDSGSDGNYILITSYGNGKAIVDGSVHEAARISGCQYFTIRNINFKGDGRSAGSKADGVVLSNCNDFVVDSIDVSGFQHSGVLVDGSRNARLTSVIAHDNGFSGILVSGPHANDPVIYDNTGLYIGYCVAYNNPGDPTVKENHSGNGILACSVNGGTIEYCEAYNNGWDMVWTGNGPVGIWIWDCNDFTIQYCISHDNKTNPVAADGGGFDLDGGVSNSVIQYCISYNNMGPGYGLFEFGAAKPWKNNLIRYNISRNDGLKNGGAVSVWRGNNGGVISDCEIHNNTFYTDTPRGISVWLDKDLEGFRFSNNIFCYSGSFIGKDQKIRITRFVNNCFFDLSGRNNYGPVKGTASERSLFVNPAFTEARWVNPVLPWDKAKTGLESLVPRTVSPVIDRSDSTGILYGFKPLSKDIIGNAIPNGKAIDLGAIELIR